MKSESQIFKYRTEVKFGAIVAMASIVVLVIFAMNSEVGRLGKTLLILLLFGFFVFLIKDNCLLNKNIELGTESINIQNYIGSSIKIRYNTIRRITIREEGNSVDANHIAMVIFWKKNIKIILSDLEDQLKIIELLENKGGEYGFNVIHQNVNGEIIRGLKNKN